MSFFISLNGINSLMSKVLLSFAQSLERVTWFKMAALEILRLNREPLRVGKKKTVNIKTYHLV